MNAAALAFLQGAAGDTPDGVEAASLVQQIVDEPSTDNAPFNLGDYVVPLRLYRFQQKHRWFGPVVIGLGLLGLIYAGHELGHWRARAQR